VRDDVEPHENFMRNWNDYKVGFGDFNREFWLGKPTIIIGFIWADKTLDWDPCQVTCCCGR